MIARSAWVHVLVLLVACTTVGPRVEAPGAPPAAADFHHDLDEFLQRHVDGEGRVDYRAAQHDRADLDRYVAWLAALSPDSDPDAFPTPHDRLAYWINAYNASVLHLVLESYPITSVAQVRPPRALFFAPRLSGFFYFRRVTLGARDLSLFQLENDLIRERFAEPRIHFALNCASIGCPRLPRRAFPAEGLETVLARETRRFLAEPRNFAVDETRRRVRLSSIFDWYEEDFVAWVRAERPAEDASLRSYLAAHLPPEAAERLHACRECELEFVDYDWGLNDRP